MKDMKMKDKIVFVKVENDIDQDECYMCCIEKISAGGGCPTPCEEGYYYKLQEEEPIQTEWEWKKERFGLLKSSNCMAGSPEDQEIKDLDTWLRKNKQKNWLTCTRENTKVGSEVRYKNSKRLLEVEHIYRDNNFCSVWDIEVEKTITNLKLDYLEIDMGEE